MGDKDQVRELIANLTRSPRGDRLLLRGQLGMTYEKDMYADNSGIMSD